MDELFVTFPVESVPGLLSKVSSWKIVITCSKVAVSVRLVVIISTILFSCWSPFWKSFFAHHIEPIHVRSHFERVSFACNCVCREFLLFLVNLGKNSSQTNRHPDCSLTWIYLRADSSNWREYLLDGDKILYSLIRYQRYQDII